MRHHLRVVTRWFLSSVEEVEVLSLLALSEGRRGGRGLYLARLNIVMICAIVISEYVVRHRQIREVKTQLVCRLNDFLHVRLA